MRPSSQLADCCLTAVTSHGLSSVGRGRGGRDWLVFPPLFFLIREQFCYYVFRFTSPLSALLFYPPAVTLLQTFTLFHQGYWSSKGLPACVSALLAAIPQEMLSKHKYLTSKIFQNSFLFLLRMTPVLWDQGLTLPLASKHSHIEIYSVNIQSITIGVLKTVTLGRS